MKLLLSTARRRPASQLKWICLTCRRRYATELDADALLKGKPISLRPDRAELQKGGPARTRFAPSPTGYLHLGSLRTALFNYMVAKASGGQFILRVEDTDQKRTVPDAEERLYQDLAWAGIEWDEGPNIGGQYGPYKQSERLPLYKEHAEKLVKSGNAYRCFCTRERLEKVKLFRASQGLGSTYDGHCALHISSEESDDRAAKGEVHSIRLIPPRASDGGIMPDVIDFIHGRIRTKPERRQKFTSTQEYADPVLLKQDGYPTYHLANVVDDHMMKITHVIRGSEWISSTSKHISIYNAFGWEPPKFGHVSLLVGRDKQKLSKRFEAMNIAELRDRGVFPEALNNFVALLGWSHTNGTDVMNMEELVKTASLKFTKGDTEVNLEKLWFLQRKHATRYAAQSPSLASSPLLNLAVAPIARHLDAKAASNPSHYRAYHRLSPARRADFIFGLLCADIQMYTLPIEFITRLETLFVFSSPTTQDLEFAIPDFTLRRVEIVPKPDQNPARSIALLFETFEQIPEADWNAAELKSWTASFVMQRAVGGGDVKGDGEEGEGTYRKSWSQRAVNGTGVGEGGVSGREEAAERAYYHAWSKLVHQSLRWAISGGASGPDGAWMMGFLGRAECLARLERAGRVVGRWLEDEGYRKTLAKAKAVGVTSAYGTPAA